MGNTVYPVTILNVNQEIDAHVLKQIYNATPEVWVDSIIKRVKASKENQIHLGEGESYLVEGYLLSQKENRVWQTEINTYRCSIKFTIETFKLEKCRKI